MMGIRKKAILGLALAIIFVISGAIVIRGADFAHPQDACGKTLHDNFQVQDLCGFIESARSGGGPTDTSCYYTGWVGEKGYDLTMAWENLDPLDGFLYTDPAVDIQDNLDAYNPVCMPNYEDIHPSSVALNHRCMANPVSFGHVIFDNVDYTSEAEATKVYFAEPEDEPHLREYRGYIPLGVMVSAENTPGYIYNMGEVGDTKCTHYSTFCPYSEYTDCGHAYAGDLIDPFYSYENDYGDIVTCVFEEDEPVFSGPFERKKVCCDVRDVDECPEGTTYNSLNRGTYEPCVTDYNCRYGRCDTQNHTCKSGAEYLEACGIRGECGTHLECERGTCNYWNIHMYCKHHFCSGQPERAFDSCMLNCKSGISGTPCQENINCRAGLFCVGDFGSKTCEEEGCWIRNTTNEFIDEWTDGWPDKAGETLMVTKMFVSAIDPYFDELDVPGAEGDPATEGEHIQRMWIDDSPTFDSVMQACHPGIEGQYYLYSTSSYNTRQDAIRDPSEAFCAEKMQNIDYDSDDGEYCRKECLGNDDNWEQDHMQGLGCCGDDKEADCLSIDNNGTGNLMCANMDDLDGNNRWVWLDIADTKGLIFKPRCLNDVVMLNTGEGIEKDSFRVCGEITDVITSPIEFRIHAWTSNGLRTLSEPVFSLNYEEGVQNVKVGALDANIQGLFGAGADFDFPMVITPIGRKDVSIFFQDGRSAYIDEALSTDIFGEITNYAPLPDFGPSFDRVSVIGPGETHAYLCVEDYEEQGPAIFECTEASPFHDNFITDDLGDWAHKLDYGDPVVTEGMSVDTGEEIWYCIFNEDTSESFFSLTLEDEDACETAFAGVSNKGWTGSTCCGEPIQDPEFYNDDLGTGGCWNGEIIENGDDVAGGTVIVERGKFRGCALGDESDILDYTDIRTDGQLVAEYEYCNVIDDVDGEATSFQCTTEGDWEHVSGVEKSRTYYKNMSWLIQFGVWDGFVEYGCCNASECWNSTGCSPDQTGKEYYQSIEGYVCLNGEWTELPFMFTPYGESGYCPSTEQCLYNTDPNSDVNCVDNGDYQMEFLCEDNEWTTRTRYLSEQLLHFANSVSADNFTLFCDDYQTILNYYPYTFEGVSVSEYVGRHCVVEGESGLQPCVNNFCILKYPGGVAFGTSLNADIDDPDRSFLQALNYDIGVCNQVTGFDRCRGTNAYYDADKNLIFYVPQGVMSQSGGDTADLFFNQPTTNVIDLANVRSDEKKYQMFGLNKRMSRSFVDKHREREITGFLEESIPFIEDNQKLFIADYLGIDMQGHSIEACDFMEGYGGDYECDEGNLAFSKIRTSGNPTAESALSAVWLDLTSKLRAR